IVLNGRVGARIDEYLRAADQHSLENYLRELGSMFRSQSNRLPFLRGCEFVPTVGLQFQMRKMEHLYCLGSLPRFPMICPLSRRHSVTRKPQISFDSAGERPE